MAMIYIATLVVLLGSSFGPSVVAQTICNIEHQPIRERGRKFQTLSSMAPLPTCQCGTISKIVYDNANNGQKKTVVTCSLCLTGEVPVSRADYCANMPVKFNPFLRGLCQRVVPACRDMTVYRCQCPDAVTTELPNTISLPIGTTPSYDESY